MKIHILFTMTIFSLFISGIPVVMSSGTYDPNKDPGLIRECRYYADHNPEASIPKERQEYLTSIGMDWQHYDYYQDCINQKKVN